MTDGTAFKLGLLGSFCVSAGSPEQNLLISSRKGRALLAYLALHPQQRAGRDELATLLWGDGSDRQARQNLRQCLVQLRRDLGPGAANRLAADTESVALRGAEVDAVRFLSLSREGEAQAVAEAVDLYRGELLAGFPAQPEPFEEWLRAERARVAAAAEKIFARHIENLAAARGGGEEACIVAERLLALDPLREDRHRLLLSLYARHAGPAAALARAKTLALVLKTELGVAPEPATLALVEEIRRSAGALEPAPADLLPEAAGRPNEGTQPPPSLPALEAKVPQRRGFSVLRRIAAGLALLVPVLAGAFAVWAHNRSFPVGTAGVSASTTRPADSWESPPFHSASAAHQPAAVRKDIIPLIVLPLHTYDNNTSVQLLADMITDDLINMLSRIAALRVISRQTSRTYGRRAIDVASLGRDLGVRYVLEGSIRQQGDRLRVNIELVEAASRLPIWSEQIDRTGADQLSVQDEVVRRLARELQVETRAAEGRRRANDNDTAALIHRGWAALSEAFSRSNLAAFDRAASYFNEVLKREPDNVSAQIGLAGYHANIGAQLLTMDNATHLQTAVDILDRIIARSPHSGGAYHYLGLALHAQGKPREALAAFEHAVELNPSAAGSHAHIGNCLIRLGRPTEALENLRYAIRLSPRDPNLAYWLDFVGVAQLELHRYAEAIEAFSRATTLNPGYPRGWAGLVAANALAGNSDAATTYAEKLRSFAPGLDPDRLVERFGRGKRSQLRHGLQLALVRAP